MSNKIVIIALVVIVLAVVAGAAMFIAQQKQERAEKVGEEKEQVATLPEAKNLGLCPTQEMKDLVLREVPRLVWGVPDFDWYKRLVNYLQKNPFVCEIDENYSLLIRGFIPIDIADTFPTMNFYLKDLRSDKEHPVLVNARYNSPSLVEEMLGFPIKSLYLRLRRGGDLQIFDVVIADNVLAQSYLINLNKKKLILSYDNGGYGYGGSHSLFIKKDDRSFYQITAKPVLASTEETPAGTVQLKAIDLFVNEKFSHSLTVDREIILEDDLSSISYTFGDLLWDKENGYVTDTVHFKNNYQKVGFSFKARFKVRSVKEEGILEEVRWDNVEIDLRPFTPKWLSYSNEKYGFEFEFIEGLDRSGTMYEKPPLNTWKEASNGFFSVSPRRSGGVFEVFVDSNDSNLPFSDYLTLVKKELLARYTEFNPPPPTYENPFLIGGQSGFVLGNYGLEGEKFYIASFPSNRHQNFLIIAFVGDPKWFNEAFRHTINSFKFTETRSNTKRQ